ncbi:hypothetical protein SZ64_07995 [Erythrobacter sp. SG61-1L]|nr:hypothetical protein SZ64_07995 [Erythrobacter sp. SG61-1L]
MLDANGDVHIMSRRGTHEMAWLALSEWAARASSIEHLISPIRFAGGSLLDPFQEFFPGGASTAIGELMIEWGFDLQQGLVDRNQRNWSSYQPTALGPILTRPVDDAAFFQMFWQAVRPNGVELERHLLRILLETEARSLNAGVADYEHRYERLQAGTKNVVSFGFLTRVVDAYDHQFLTYLADRAAPAHPYAMLCRAGLLLKLAIGMAEENLRAAGVQPTQHFNDWWQDFGAQQGLWPPGNPPEATVDLWSDIELALEDCAAAPTGHRHEWITALAGNAIRMCETERAALWGLFQ